jgi:biotin transport system substrate-specific component
MGLATSQALVPQLLNKATHKNLAEMTQLIGGVFLLALLAQVSIPLPWTPVPITGQTLGIALVSLSWGQKRAFTVVLTYLALGSLGLPIFAMGKSGLLLGPTAGYLIGMAIASIIVGSLADRGFTKTFKHSLVASFAGSAAIFTCGLIGLSFYVPQDQLMAAGLLPFIPGDVIKNLIAATTSRSLRKLTQLS